LHHFLSRALRHSARPGKNHRRGIAGTACRQAGGGTVTKKSLTAETSHRTAPYAIKANIDGGARGNPGPAAYGVVVRNAEGKIIDEIAEYLGIQTNNFAEYSGLLAALEYAVREKYPSLKVVSDSELLVKQMKGQYRVKNPGLLELYD